ncbi:MAG: serine/threonine protein kinase [Lentisphaerae bacterium]|nr:MAG: serine/threonine protein kinase [Lentisphaerota bacterium]
MGSIVFSCPHCEGKMEVEQGGLKGRLVACPHCGKQIKVPDEPEEAAGPAEDVQQEEEEEVVAETLTAGCLLSEGTVVKGIYRIVRHLGESSLGEVYVADMIGENRKVQLEIISSSEQETVERLSREIEFLAALQHPNIVRAFDAGQDGEIFFLASEYEEGITLRELLDKKGKLPEKEALTYALHIAQALEYAWEQRKILHRDIKPSNIFITNSGKAKLMGFGIAKSSESQSLGLTGIGYTVGTPQYMSPEQIRAEEDLDCRSDMYILGCVIYEMIAGQVPFDDKVPMVVMQKQMDEDPPPITDFTQGVSQATQDLLAKLLAKDRNDRPASWTGTVQLLKHAIEQEAAPSASAQASAPKAEETSASQAAPSSAAQPSLKEKLGCASVFLVIPSLAVFGVIAREVCRHLHLF